MPTHTIAENLERLNDAKTAIAEAITTAGGTVNSGDGLEDFATDIGTIPSGNATFGYSPAYERYSPKALVSITIPSGPNAIADNAFKEYRDLESVTIPDSVTLIGDSAFQDCTSLTSVTFPDTYDEPGAYVSLGDSCFNGCSSLTSITLPEGIYSLGPFCFGRSGLTEIEIPSTVRTIDSNAFQAANSLETIIIHQAEDSIPDAPWGAYSATITWTG